MCARFSSFYISEKNVYFMRTGSSLQFERFLTNMNKLLRLFVAMHLIRIGKLRNKWSILHLHSFVCISSLSIFHVKHELTFKYLFRTFCVCMLSLFSSKIEKLFLFVLVVLCEKRIIFHQNLAIFSLLLSAMILLHNYSHAFLL